MLIIRLIIEIASRLIPQKAMKPSTPSSIDMIAKATQREQMGLGMKTRETMSMMRAARPTH